MIRTAGILQLLLGQHGPARRRHHGHARPLHHPGLDRRRRRCTTCCPATCRSRPPTSSTRRWIPTSSTRDCPPATGPTSASSSSACSRPGTATRPRRRTTSASRGCRGWTATIRNWPTSTAWPGARSRATSCSARTPAAAGPTPACTGPACATSTGWWSLDWFETESAVFWKSDPNGPPPAEIKTEVFFIPAAAAPEKEGSFTNTQRLLQWHDKALDPLGDSRSDAWFLYHLGKRLKQLYAGSTDPRDQPLLRLTWDYDFDERPRLPDGTVSRIEGEPDLEKVLRRSTAITIWTRSTRGPGRPQPAERLLRAEGRRHDGVRLLDLQRRLPRAGPQPGPRAQAHRQPAAAGMGLRLAAQPPGPVQPRLAPTPTAGRGRSGRSSSGGTRRSSAGWASTSRTSSRTSRPTTGRRRARRAWRPSPATSRSS